MNVINTRLLQRLDTLQNWQTTDPVLLSGELAIVSSSTRMQFKVGNGTSTFNQLPYTDANLSTNAEAIGTGVSVQADGSFATGINAQASALNTFVFNGDNSLVLDQNNHLAFPPPYKDHGNGTFNVNAPLSDIYIQQSAFSDIFSDKADKIELDAKITIDDQISGICAQTDLSIVKLSANDYAELVSTDSTVSNCLYIVEDDIINACGQQISNLAPGTSLSDAVNLEQLCDAVSSIQLPTDLSDFTNNSGFLTKTSADVDFQPVGNYLSANALANYYTKSETSSASEIQTALENAGGSGSNVQVSADYQTGTRIATISVDDVPTEIYVPSTSNSSRYALVTAQLVSDNGSLTCAVDDQAITTIQVSSSTTPIVVQLPTQQVDGARDFILRIEISSSAAPTFTFNGVNETIDFDSEDDDWAVMEPGLNLVSFTETKRGN